MQAGFFKHTILPGFLLLVGVGWLTNAARAQSEMTIVRTVVNLTASDQLLLPGQQLKLIASVAMEDGGEVPGGLIEFIDETHKRVIGRTGISTPWIVLHRLPDGSHTVRARYSGLQSYFPFVIDPSTSAPMVYTVRTVPHVVISSSQNPSTLSSATSRMVTLPLGVPSRLFTATVSVTACPGVLGFCDDEITTCGTVRTV